VRLDDVDLTKLRELTRLRRERIGFVFQAFNLLPMLTARENVVLPLRIAGLTGRAVSGSASSSRWWLVG
jgi:putative ABC transport system ATP-binding protein